VLTIADIRAVGPGVWNGWKGQLLRELFIATEAVFRGGRASDAVGVARRRQEALAYDARIALAETDANAKTWAAAMEDAYFVAFSGAEHRLHARLAERARGEAGAAARAEVRAERNATEIIVAAPDRPALFANLALAISANGGNVVGARIFTSAAGEVLDVFFVQDGARAPFGADHPRALDRLLAALENAGRGAPGEREARRGVLAERPSPFDVSPSVTFDNDASHQATVIEASGRDRPGLLEALARALAESHISVQSAHIDGYGERVVDTFYVVGGDGAKIVEPGRLAQVRARLVEVLEADPAARPGRLPKARASAAR
jgi:[protein-PII] uridylyltransferase